MRTQTPIELARVLAWTIAKDCSQNVLKLFAAQVAGSPRLGLGLGSGLGWGPGCLKIDDNRGRCTPGLFIVLTITKRAHYKAKSEATCRVSVLKLVSPNQPDSQQLWGQSTSKPNALILHEQAPLVWLGLGLGLGLGWGLGCLNVENNPR